MGIFKFEVNEKNILRTLDSKAVREALVTIVAEGLEAAKSDGTTEKDEHRDSLVGGMQVAESRYREYLELPEVDRRALQNVVNSTSLLTFVVSGCLEDNLVAVWDYCQLQVERGREMTRLAKIFVFFLETVSSTGCGPHYELLDTRSGEMYDEAVHKGDSGSAVVGHIKRVLLPGFKFAGKKGVVVRRSIVRVY